MTNRHRSRRNSQKNSQVRNIKQKSPDLNIKQKSPDLEDIKLVFKLLPHRNPIVGHENFLNNRSSSSNSVLGRKVVKEHGLECKIERNWLGIKCYGDKLLALSPEGNLFLYDRSSGLVLCSTPTGKPLHVSHGSSVSLAAICELYEHAKGSELADLNFKASDLVGKSDVFIVPSKSETVLYVNQRTGHLSSATNSVNDEILCIKRFDFQITCYEENTNTVLGYRRITSIHVSEVSRSDPRFCEKNDALARMGQTLVKQGTVGKIFRSNRVIGEGDKDTVLVEGEVQKRAVIACVKKGQTLVSNLIDICDANSNFVNVYAVEKDRDFIYVATERCDMSLRAFMKSFHNPENQHLKDRDKLLKLIWEIVTAIASLHYNGISHGNIDINNIFVDKYSRAKIQFIGKGFRSRDAFKDRFSLSKEATDDMYALGKVIYFCFTGVEYKGEDLYNLKPEKYLKPVYDCPDSLDFLRKLLVKKKAKRVTALQAYNHTLFWSSRKRLRFIRAVTERLELKPPALLRAIKSIKQAVFGEYWNTKLPSDFVDLMKKGSSGTIWVDSMYDLICIIRNLVTHETKIRDQIESSEDTEVHEMFGPAGFESYFRRKFPNLVNQVYNAMGKHLGGEPNFLQFYNKKPL